MSGRLHSTIVGGLFTLAGAFGGALLTVLGPHVLPKDVGAPIQEALTSQRVRDIEARIHDLAAGRASLEAQLNVSRQQLAEVAERLKTTQKELEQSRAAAEEARERARIAESKPANPLPAPRELPGASPPPVKPAVSPRREGPTVVYLSDYTFEAQNVREEPTL